MAGESQDGGADYAAFISYAHVDSRWATWLHRTLETYRLPRSIAGAAGRRRLGRVFLDRSELATSASLSDRIADALANARNLIVICSPAARASRWVNEEVRRFRASGRGERIFCLIVDGDPARDDDRGCFPPALIEPVDGTMPIEPLAADVRPGKDRRADARLKLIAGLLNLRFDALRRRDHARRQRVLGTVLAVTLALLGIMSVLTVVALVSRSEALRQRDTAEETAAFLRRLLLGADPGTAMGREVSVRDVVSAAEREALASPTLASQTEVKASLLVTLAEVDLRLREMASGDRLIAAARTLNPTDPLTRLRIAIADAGLDLWRSDMAGLARALTDGFAIVDRDPGLSADYRAQLLAYRAQGVEAGNRYGDAMRDWRAARQLSLARRPPDADNVIAALTGEAKTAIASGDLDRARPLLAQAVAMRRAMGQPEHPSVLLAMNELGTIAAKRGKMAVAERWYRRTIAAQRRIQGADGLDVGLSRNNLGRALLEQRRFADALVELDAARATILAQAGAWEASLANLEDSRGLALAATGWTDEARAAFARGLAVARANRMPKAIELLSDRAELECATGSPAIGRRLVDEARAALAGFALPEPWRAARIDAVEGGCRLATGDDARARALLRHARPIVAARWGAGSLFDADVARALARLP